MKLALVKLCILLVVFSTTTQSSKIKKDCKALLENPDKLPISLINECTSEENNQQIDDPIFNVGQDNCSDFDPETCGPEPLNCIFGYLKDPNGCDYCECNTDGHDTLFEGDIIVLNRLDEYITSNYEGLTNHKTKVKRGAAKEVQLWNNKKEGDNFIVPYVISNTIGSAGKRAILEAAADFAKHTCIRLKPRMMGDTHYINFKGGSGCASPIGRLQKRQDVYLARGCWQKGTVLHEIMHSLGFFHEQSRPDRDDEVMIMYENIQSRNHHNFNKFRSIHSMGSPYDRNSILHYSAYAFSRNGRPTILDRKNNNMPVKTQGNDLSEQDIIQVNKMYGCQLEGASTTIPTTTPTTTTRTTTTPASACTDNYKICGRWASQGFCKYPFVRLSCTKSCSKRC